MKPLLYDYVLSASCYKVRLFASLLGVELETRAVDFHPGREHKSVKFRKLNPAGTLPVLVCDELVLTESSAMLVYLARKWGRHERWSGDDTPEQSAQIQAWLAFAARLGSSLGIARLHDVLQTPTDIDAVRASGTEALQELEAHLNERRFALKTFLICDHPTIADIACFPNVALASDGGVKLDDYPSVRLWMRAIRSLPRFIEMPGIHRMHELRGAPEPAPAGSI
jgi:glutathione S-transferase